MIEEKSIPVVIELNRASGKYASELLQHLEAERRRKLRKKAQSPEVLYAITREEIENRDIKRLCRTFNLTLPPAELRNLRGRVRFAIRGYDEAEEELLEIAAVRRFVRHSCKFWDGWTYFCSLGTCWMRVVACCLIESVRVVRTASGPVVMVGVGGQDWLAYYNESLPAFACYSFRADPTLTAGTKYIQRVAKYLGLRKGN
jgi:hypothetical protein